MIERDSVCLCVRLGGCAREIVCLSVKESLRGRKEAPKLKMKLDLSCLAW